MPPRKNSTPSLPVDSPSRRRLPPLLRKAWFSLNQAFRRRISHLGLTPDQFTVLRTLQEADPEGISQNQLAERMSSDPNTIASLLERMEKNDLLARLKDPKDRRVNKVVLNTTGKERYEIARNIAVGLQSEVLEAVPHSSRDAFLEHLTAVAEACEQAAEKSPKGRKSSS